MCGTTESDNALANFASTASEVERKLLEKASQTAGFLAEDLASLLKCNTGLETVVSEMLSEATFIHDRLVRFAESLQKT